MTHTWILVADGGRARVFEMADADKALVEVACYANPDARLPGKESTTDRPPSVNESMGGTRHAVEPHTTIRDKIADRFAHSLIAALERGRQEHRYGSLVIVAPPRFLGVLHSGMDKPLRDCVVEEVRHDYTSLPVAQLRERLPTRLFL
jgi:protein required for attachment to host cells